MMETLRFSHNRCRPSSLAKENTTINVHLSFQPVFNASRAAAVGALHQFPYKPERRYQFGNRKQLTSTTLCLRVILGLHEDCVFDPDNGTYLKINSDSTLSPYFQQNKKFKSLQKPQHLSYNDLDELFGGNCATGAYMGTFEFPYQSSPPKNKMMDLRMTLV